MRVSRDAPRSAGSRRPPYSASAASSVSVFAVTFSPELLEELVETQIDIKDELDERRERLKRLALESIDLAKDPWLVRNHYGMLECKLCGTLHRDEADYLAHTQGKKHQAALGKRAHMEKLQAERNAEQQQTPSAAAAAAAAIQDQPKTKKVRIGRPAYQVFKSREAETQQRCLSFELSFPEIETGLQPRHRFMSAFEQRVEEAQEAGRKSLLLLVRRGADPRFVALGLE